MGTLKEAAEKYEPKKTLNIADLESFDISEELVEKEDVDEDGNPYEYSVLVRDGKEYRVPNIVLKDLKNIIEANAKHEKVVTTFAVEKTGEGLKTRYSIVTLD